jgi:hypothetical protein
MADEAELERLVVRLLGDGSDYRQMAQEAQQQTAELDRHLEESAEHSKHLAEGIKHFAETTVEALEAIGAEELLRGAFEGAAERQKAIIGLTATLESNGHATKELIADYAAFNEELTKLTPLTDEQVNSMLKQAEAFGLSGAKAKDAVLGAIGLAAATNQSAESMLRLMVAYQQGNTFMLRHILHLHNVKDDSEVVARAQQAIAAGLREVQQTTATTNGTIAQARKEWGEFKADLGEVVEEAIAPVVEWLRMAAEALREMSPASKEAVVAALAIVAGLLALGPALAVAKLALAPLWAMLSLVTSTLFVQVPALALQAAWWTISAVASAGYSAAMLVVHGVLWLVNLAMAAFNLLGVAGVVVVAALAAVVGAVLVAAFAALAVVAYSAYTAVSEAFRALRALPTDVGPLKAITSIFNEWLGVLKDVVRAAKMDLPLAGEIAAAGFRLAVEQVKQMWPPVWAFLKEGWAALSDLIASKFKESFFTALEAVMVGVMHSDVAVVFARVFGIKVEDMGNARDAAMKAKWAARDAVDKAQDDLNKIQFKLPGDSLEVKEAREKLNELRGQLAEAEAKAAKPRMQKLEVPKPPDLPKPQFPPVEVKVVPKVQAVAFGSAEARTRLADYFEESKVRFQQPTEHGGRLGDKEVERQQLNVLQQMNGHLAKMADKEPMELNPVGIA